MCLIREIYPNLSTDEYTVTSRATARYNSVAFAIYGDEKTDCCWWPVPYCEDEYPWPAERKETLKAFTRVFKSVGYQVCKSQELEPEFEKVAIYVDKTGKPTHVARQHFNKEKNQWIWKSKVGEVEDIEHEKLSALNPVFGSVARVLKR